MKLTRKQECIPVGFLPPARWPYPIVSDGGGGGVWGGGFAQTPPDADPSLSPVNRMTHRCKNITLP